MSATIPPSEPAQCETFVSKDIELIEDGFGFLANKITGESVPIRSFTWRNKHKICVQVINYGATITKIKTPNRKGEVHDIVMGYDDIDGYREPNNPYFGATVGRVCNRVNNGTFLLNGKIYNVSQNYKNTHQLHGGFIGFDKVIWNYYIENTKVTMTYLSKDGEEGYPGDVLTSVSFELMPDNRFVIQMKATSTKPTPVNLTNHSYFNLAGHGAGAEELQKHVVLINADSYTITNEDSIPTGRIKSVANTLYDLQVPIKLGEVLYQIPGGGYDNNLCVNRGIDQDLSFVARVAHPPSGRVMEVYSNQPGVQFYTANNLPPEARCCIPPCKPECKADCTNNKNENDDSDSEGNTTYEGPTTESYEDPVADVKGKDNILYKKHGSLCLETQNYPDAVNHSNFPCSILNPGETYLHVLVYKFWLTKSP